MRLKESTDLFCFMVGNGQGRWSRNLTTHQFW